MLGRLDETRAWVARAVEFGDRADDRYDKLADRFTLGDILHQTGRFAEAEAAFIDADQVTDVKGQRIPNAYFFWAFPWCELLIALDRHQEVRARALWAPQRSEECGGSLLAPAQMHLALGSAIVAELLAGPGGGPEAAAGNLQKALDLLRRATHQVHLPRGLLVRAAPYRLQGNFKTAGLDLEEVMRMATRSGMYLCEADCWLEFTRLRIAEGYTDHARSNLAKAREMITDVGYGRRDADLAALEAALA